LFARPGEDGTAMTDRGDTSDTTIGPLRMENGEVLLHLAGELDLSYVDMLWEAAAGALNAAPSRLVIDVSAVTFIDSSILGALVRINRATKEQGASFSLRQPRRVVTRLLQLSGLQADIEVEA